MDEDEFGGFEAAEIEEEEQAPAQGLQASPSPWAFFPGQNQPDLIRPPGQMPSSSSQEIRPNVQDPLEPNFPRSPQASLLQAAAVNNSVSQNASAPANVANVGNMDWEADFKQYDQAADSRSLSEQVLEPHFGSLKSDQPVPDGVLDLDLTQRQQVPRPVDELDLDLEPDIQQMPVVNAAQPLPEESIEPGEAANERAGDIAVQGLVEGAVGLDKSAEEEATQQQIQASDEEKCKLQKEIEDLIKNNQVLEKEIGDLQAELSEQREKYSTLQQQHTQDLEDMRKSGQEALAIIVEEYKELCKTCVLEQQVSCQEQLQAAVQGEQEKWKELLKVQQDEFEKQIEEEKKKLSEDMKEILEKQRLHHQEEINEVVNKENRKLEDEIQDWLKKIRDENETLVKEEFSREKEKWKESLQEEKEKLQSFLEEEKQKNKESLGKAVSDESETCQEYIVKCMSEEQVRSSNLLKEASISARQEVTLALQQQKQRDTAVKKKSLASIDLFLESARHQLRLLMETEPLVTESGDNNIQREGGDLGSGCAEGGDLGQNHTDKECSDKTGLNS